LLIPSALEKAKLHETLGQFQETISAYEAHAQLVAGTDADAELFSRAKAAQILLVKVDAARGIQLMRELRQRLVAKGAPAAFDARRIVSETLFQTLEGQFARFQGMKVSDPSMIEQQVQN